MRYFPIIILTLMSFSAPSLSSEQVIAGIGTKSCGEWINGRDMKDQSMDLMFVSYLQGLFSGINLQISFVEYENKPDEDVDLNDLPMIDIPDPHTLLIYLDKYCLDNPLGSVMMGAIKLHDELKLKQSSLK